jgi:hypothetical protein
MSTLATKITLAVSLLLALSGCRSGAPAPTTAPSASGGGFPIVQLTYADRVDQVELRSDYGYIVDWPGDRRPAFYVFDRPRRTRIRVETWDAFVTELRNIPNGSEIDSVSKCRVPFAWGMPENKRQELADLLARKRLRTVAFDDQERHTDFCYCETRRITVLAGPAR